MSKSVGLNKFNLAAPVDLIGVPLAVKAAAATHAESFIHMELFIRFYEPRCMELNMYKNRASDNTNNICGASIARLRKNASPKLSQRALADKLQLIGMDLDKNAIQRIESGKRFVTDIELLAFARTLRVTTDELLAGQNTEKR